MKRESGRILTGLLLFFYAIFLHAGKGFVTEGLHGRSDDSLSCLRNISIYSSFYNNNEYEMAAHYWRDVFRECPASSKNTYIRGEAIYREFFRSTGDKAFLDTILIIIDQRSQYFNEEPSNTLRKAFALYELGGNDPHYAIRGYNYMKEVASDSPGLLDNTYSTLYMAVTARCYTLGLIDAATLSGVWSGMRDIADNHLSQNSNDTAYREAVTNIDAILISAASASCTTLSALLEPVIDNNHGDTLLLRRLLTLLSGSGCHDSKLYLQAATTLHQAAPGGSTAALLAEGYRAGKDYDQAYRYYKEAVTFESDSISKSALLTRLASLELTEGNRESARDHARRAGLLNQTNGTAMLIIAEAYANAKTGDLFDNQALYWVVADYLVRAAEREPALREQVEQRIAACAKLFPTREDAFFRSIVEEGAPYRVGGWINESTTVRFRKEVKP